MWALVVSSLLVSAPPEVTVRTLDGREVTGAVVELAAGRVVLKQGEQSTTIAADQLLNVRPAKASPVPSNVVSSVALVDGSLLSGAVEFEVADGQVRLGFRDYALAGPAKAISWAQLKPETPASKPAWTNIKTKVAAQGFKGDVLIVGKGDTVDFFEGVLYDTGKDKDGNKTIKFDLDGETKEVRFDRVAGVAYLQPAASENSSADPICTITASDGSRLRLKSAALKDGQLDFETLSGLKGSRPIEQLSLLDFSAGKVAYLGAGAEIASDELGPVRPPVVRPSAKYAAFNPRYYEPRSKNWLWVSQLKVGGKSYERGLLMAIECEMTYPLRGNYKHLRMTAGMDDSVKDGRVQLIIRGDGKELFNGVIDRSQPPKSLDLDVTNVRLLDIMSRPISLSGAYLDLCEAKVTK